MRRVLTLATFEARVLRARAWVVLVVVGALLVGALGVGSPFPAPVRWFGLWSLAILLGVLQLEAPTPSKAESPRSTLPVSPAEVLAGRLLAAMGATFLAVVAWLVGIVVAGLAGALPAPSPSSSTADVALPSPGGTVGWILAAVVTGVAPFFWGPWRDGWPRPAHRSLVLPLGLAAVTGAWVATGSPWAAVVGSLGWALVAPRHVRPADDDLGDLAEPILGPRARRDALVAAVGVVALGELVVVGSSAFVPTLDAATVRGMAVACACGGAWPSPGPRRGRGFGGQPVGMPSRGEEVASLQRHLPVAPHELIDGHLGDGLFYWLAVSVIVVGGSAAVGIASPRAAFGAEAPALFAGTFASIGTVHFLDVGAQARQGSQRRRLWVLAAILALLSSVPVVAAGPAPPPSVLAGWAATMVAACAASWWWARRRWSR